MWNWKLEKTSRKASFFPTKGGGFMLVSWNPPKLMLLVQRRAVNMFCSSTYRDLESHINSDKMRQKIVFNIQSSSQCKVPLFRDFIKNPTSSNFFRTLDSQVWFPVFFFLRLQISKSFILSAAIELAIWHLYLHSSGFLWSFMPFRKTGTVRWMNHHVFPLLSSCFIEFQPLLVKRQGLLVLR